MKKESQIIALAELCGWVNQGRAKGVKALEHRWNSPDGEFFNQADLPDYLNDLNAVHEAEKMLGDFGPVIGKYISFLGGIHSSPGRAMWACAHATAAQRAEAILRAAGKWGETKLPAVPATGNSIAPEELEQKL